MKYSINVNYESESLEDDLSKIVEIALGAVDKYFQIKKENETQSEITNLQHTVCGFDNRLDGIEAKLDSFKEVETPKTSSGNKK